MWIDLKYIFILSSWWHCSNQEEVCWLACSHITWEMHYLEKGSFTRPYRRCELDHVIIKFPNQTKMVFPSYSTSFESLSHAWNYFYLRCCKKLNFLYLYLLSEHCTCLYKGKWLFWCTEGIDVWNSFEVNVFWYLIKKLFSFCIDLDTRCTLRWCHIMSSFFAKGKCVIYWICILMFVIILPSDNIQG